MYYTLLIKQIYQDGNLLPNDYSGPVPWRETTDVFTYTSFEFDKLKMHLSTIHAPVIHDNIDSFNSPHIKKNGEHDWPKMGSHLLLIRDGVIMDIQVKTRQKAVNELYCEVYP